MTSSYPLYAAWLADHPDVQRQLRSAEPADLSRCASCSRITTPLAILSCPSGGYALCVRCLGRDAEDKEPRTPAAIPPAPPRILGR